MEESDMETKTCKSESSSSSSSSDINIKEEKNKKEQEENKSEKKSVLILYTILAYNTNVDHFLTCGLVESPDVHYILNVSQVAHDPYTAALESYLSDVKRRKKNLGFVRICKRNDDWSLRESLYENVKYVCMIDSRARGPFMPVWMKPGHWWCVLGSRLSTQVGVVVSTFCCVTSTTVSTSTNITLRDSPTKRSVRLAPWAFAMDRRVAEEVFTKGMLQTKKKSGVWELPPGALEEMANAVSCDTYCLESMSLSPLSTTTPTPTIIQWNFYSPILQPTPPPPQQHPYETVFVNANDAHTSLSPLVQLHTVWCRDEWRQSGFRSLVSLLDSSLVPSSSPLSLTSLLLVIQEAWFGPVNVTAPLTRRIVNNSLCIAKHENIVNLLVASHDPMPFKSKFLYIRYSWCGDSRSKLLRESQLCLTASLEIGAGFDPDPDAAPETVRLAGAITHETNDTEKKKEEKTKKGEDDSNKQGEVKEIESHPRLLLQSETKEKKEEKEESASRKRVRQTFVLLTVCLTEENNKQLQKEQYMRGITSVVEKCKNLQHCRVCIVENNSSALNTTENNNNNNVPHRTFLDDFGVPVLYTKNNLVTPDVDKEYADVRDSLLYWNVHDDDFVVKMAGRYYLHPVLCPFFDHISSPTCPYDSIMRYEGSSPTPTSKKGDRVTTGLIGLACKHVKNMVLKNSIECSWAAASLDVPDDRSCSLLLLGVYMAPDSDTYHLA